MHIPLYNTIRLWVLRRQEPYRVFYDMLGFCPNNIQLFQQACRHRSANRDYHNKGDNERLEFLGDAILGAIVSDIIFETYKSKNEGFLSKTRSKIVQRETLNHVATDLGLNNIVETTMHSTSHNNYTYGNALEALIGAIYLDQGYEKCRKIVEERIIKKYIDIEKIARQELNFKSRLIEWCQHHHLPYYFETIDTTADNHNNPIFTARIYITDTLLGEGSGYTKKEAQQNAAHVAMRHIRKQHNYAEVLRSNLTTEEQETAVQDLQEE